MGSLARDRDQRSREPEAAADEQAAPRHKPLPRPVDPFLAQLQALQAQLGGRPAPVAAPAPAPVEEADGPRNRRERRALLAAQRSLQPPPSADAPASPTEPPAETSPAERSPEPASDAAPAQPSEPSAPESAPAEPSPDSERPN
jgi:hypothetical protein